MVAEVQIFHKFLQIVVVFGVLLQLECFFVQGSHVFVEKHRLDVLLQHLQLEVLFSMVVWDYRDSVVQLVDVGVGRVVHQHHLRKVPVHYPQILHVHSLWGLHAVLPEQSVVHKLLLGV